MRSIQSIGDNRLDVGPIAYALAKSIVVLRAGGFKGFNTDARRDSMISHNPYDSSHAAFHDWLEQHCEVEGTASLSDAYARLFQSWKRFATARKVVFRDRQFFNRWMSERGFERERTGLGDTLYVGLRLAQ